MSIGDWLGRRALLTPDRVALWDCASGEGPARPITYRAWDRQANRTARLLSRSGPGGLGVRRGDRVAVLASNCVEYLDTWFALGKIGAVLQNLNWRLLPGELQRLIADARPVALIYGEEFIPKVQALRAQLPASVRFVALGRRAHPDDLPFSAREEESDAPGATPEATNDLSWDDPWVVCYTGGSTGLPRGAVLTHRSITANAVNTVISWGLCADDVAVLDAPLFHTGGLNVFTAPLVYVGGASVVCRRFEPEQTFDLLRDAGVTLYFGVPTMFQALQEHPRWAGADLSRLRLVISGGAPCPLPVFERFFEKDVAFRTGYGLTEAGPNNFFLPAAEARRKPGSVGHPLFHVDARIVRPDGAPCALGEVGELWLRGPHVCAGYLNHPPDGQAWLRTGDLARQDDEGCYYIVGRAKDMIISGGENVYPAEIESVLCGHPAVLEAAVIAVPDDRWGEVGRAVVVLRSPAPADLLSYLRERLAGYKVPRSVVFVPTAEGGLPRTGAGKVDKRLLKERYGQPQM